ncbi:class I SAM-dependent methyltransferase [Candidatus Omnitrophota bacterium]
MSAKKLEYYGAKGEDIIEFVPRDAKHVLDIGCGLGLTGKAIKKSRKDKVEVIGVEMESEIARQAEGSLDMVIVGNIETLKLPFEKGYFDCIIYGDLLEHLVDPWGLLAKHKDFLKEGGTVIARIPNIAHYRTIKMLFRKEWTYEDRGILDRTHIRFFALKSIKEMFANAGFDIINIGHRISASKVKKVLNKLLFGAILDYITEQYIIVAKG